MMIISVQAHDVADLFLKEKVLAAPSLKRPLVLKESLGCDICQRVVDPCHLVAPHVTPLLLLLCGEAAQAGLGVLVQEEVLTFSSLLSFPAR